MNSGVQSYRARTDGEIMACFPVMRQLRPHLEVECFLERVRTQESEGFMLACLTDAGVVRAVAGYRVLNLLFSGRTFYIDDLVTDEGTRSRGHGAKLLEWLAAEARAGCCERLTLDSGVERFNAHRFYHRMGMAITAHHFTWMKPL